MGKGAEIVNDAFGRIDELLYRHEQPYYHACAGGAYFTVTKQWQERRRALTDLWLELNPWVKEQKS